MLVLTYVSGILCEALVLFSHLMESTVGRAKEKHQGSPLLTSPSSGMLALRIIQLSC